MSIIDTLLIYSLWHVVVCLVCLLLFLLLLTTDSILKKFLFWVFIYISSSILLSVQNRVEFFFRCSTFVSQAVLTKQFQWKNLWSFEHGGILNKYYKLLYNKSDDWSIYPSFIYSGWHWLSQIWQRSFPAVLPDILSTRNVRERSESLVHAKYVLCICTLLFSMKQWKIWARDIVDHTIMIMLAWNNFFVLLYLHCVLK